ncbi:hypothetical protein CVT25_003055 [Psilocybe cyanescens]|uniref:HMG box domain-containing protein n=1 Tax=Psilocybe cyanescens TaxID=93625 RepID=A0A409XK80_PSICY|nr:hypothetical protein CVT25_003055 [Psilocybe cyanescens]
MSLDRDQDVVIEDVEEDGEHKPSLGRLTRSTRCKDMPPLVDNPNPNYTFFSGMTPLSFTSTSAPTASQDSNPQPSRSLISSLPASPITPDASTSSFSIPMSQPRPHGKRRDPSYIPRPPNAFILFRCAFIKEQNVPGKVEGNHSKLSKIIGLCWKQLTPEEREKWEAKAVLAQAEHRAHYPDWRFRPGANALAKLKIQDGAGPVTSRRRSVHSRTVKILTSPEDGDEDGLVLGETKGKGKEKGKGKTKSSRMLSIEETRCAKIAGFVAEGIKGQELEVAVKEWEGDHKMPKTSPRIVKPKGRASQASATTSSRTKSSSTSGAQLSAKQTSDEPPELSSSAQSSWTPDLSSTRPNASGTPGRAPSKISTVDSVGSAILSDVPLTHMYKRAPSAPVSNMGLPYEYSSERSSTSSGEDSPSPGEPSPGQWGSFKSPETREAPARPHTHSRRDTISLPMQSGSAAGTLDSPHHLTWQEAENQRRMEELHGPESWWSQRSPSDSPQLGYSDHTSQQQSVAVRHTTEGMGYDAPHRGNQFDRRYLERFGPYDHVQDGSHRVEWTHLSPANNRQGLVAVIEDPYKEDCNNASSSNSIPTLSLPTLPNSSYYHSPISPQTSSFPSSSFSTLTGWAGDYRNNTSAMKTWSSDNILNHSSRSWYNSEAALSWGPGRPELHRPHLAVDSEDWDRIEYRTASNLHLPVEPPRQLDFIGELRRAQGGTA